MENKEVELRSEEVQEVMGQIPNWIIRWGVTLLFVVVMALVIGSYFFKYPDVIVSEMTLTSRHPVAQIVSRTSGKISSLYVKDGQKVEEGASLAIIENPAVTEDVIRLSGLLEKYQTNPDSMWHALSTGKEFGLGDIQSVYASFLNSLHEYNTYQDLNYYPKKIASVRGQLDRYRAYYQNQERQQKVMEEQYGLAQKQYTRDSLLFVRKVISPSEYETAKVSLLQSRYSLEGANASLENMRIQIGQLEESLLDLELQKAEKETLLLQNYRTATEQLINAVNGWELNYNLSSPISGKVTFTKYWSANQFITAGENVFTIVPFEKEQLVGKALLPSERSGKVKVGQRVIIRFANYPDQEFGIVNGVVSSISMVPSEGNYTVEIDFPHGLTTNYGKVLPVSQEMKASAEIVTEELRLIERFFQPLKKIFKEGFEA